jgi:hypothetical protein
VQIWILKSIFSAMFLGAGGNQQNVYFFFLQRIEKSMAKELDFARPG